MAVVALVGWSQVPSCGESGAGPEGGGPRAGAVVLVVCEALAEAGGDAPLGPGAVGFPAAYPQSTTLVESLAALVVGRRPAASGAGPASLADLARRDGRRALASLCDGRLAGSAPLRGYELVTADTGRAAAEAALALLDRGDGSSPPLLLVQLPSAEDAEGHAALGGAVRALLDGLAARGLLEDALIALTAARAAGQDAAGGPPPARIALGRVPLLVRAPRAGPVETSAAPVQHLDLFTTFAEALGAPAGTGPGASLFRPPPPDRDLVQESGPPASPDLVRGLVTERWRLVLEADGQARLYERASGPAEPVDLAPSLPGPVASLVERLLRRTERGAGAPRPDASPPAIGYGR